MVDYYKVLGVKREASPDDIKRAYRLRAKTMHPDINRSSSANNDFALVNEAYGVLSDPDKKRKYDLRLAYGDFYLANSVFTHNGQKPHVRKKHPDPAKRESHHAHDSGYYYSKSAKRSESEPETGMAAYIYNLFFAAGMFIGFLMIFLTIGFVYVRMWPYVFLLMTIPGFILIREGWKGISRVKKSRKKQGRK